MGTKTNMNVKHELLLYYVTMTENGVYVLELEPFTHRDDILCNCSVRYFAYTCATRTKLFVAIFR